MVYKTDTTPKYKNGIDTQLESRLDITGNDVKESISAEIEILLNNEGCVNNVNFSGKDLTSLDLIDGASFVDCDFSNCNLTGLDLSNVTFKNCKFESACFDNVTFGKFISCDLRNISSYQFHVTETSKLIDCDFTDATLGLCTSDFQFLILNCKFNNINNFFNEEDLFLLPFIKMNVEFSKNIDGKYDADFRNCENTSNFDEIDLSGLDLSEVNLQGADLRWILFSEDSFNRDVFNECLVSADLKGANLAGADLTGAQLEGVDLRGADLRGAKLKSVFLKGANLAGADLTGAHLENANLSGACFTEAILKGVILTKNYLGYANLRGVNLQDAKLQGADLRGVNLQDAKLQGADLRGACLVGADLEGADLRDALLHNIIIYEKVYEFIIALDATDENNPFRRYEIQSHEEDKELFVLKLKEL